MKAVAQPISTAVESNRSKVGEYVAMTKPRLNFLVLATTLAGFYLASSDGFNVVLLIHTLIGTALVAASASVLNQYIERDADACMKRTEDRPLPTGRLQPHEALWFGLATGFLGTAYLSIAVNLTTALLAGLTWYSYLCLYTPMKSQTWLNTAVGAIPGALPPMIGWTAASNRLSLAAFVLFGIMFLWQFPHFYAIAWKYKDDYARAGFRMLPWYDASGVRTARQMVWFAAVLVPFSVLPTVMGLAGNWYGVGALALGFVFLAFCVACLRHGVEKHARRVFLFSLLYLPLLFALLTLDKV